MEARLFELISDNFLQNYTTNFFLSYGHVQTILLFVFQVFIWFAKRFLKFYRYKYDRKIIKFSDGGITAVDTAIPYIAKTTSYNPDAILVIIPGFNSSNKDYYIRQFVDDFCHDFECRILNIRGYATELSNEKMISYYICNDIKEYVEEIKDEGKPIYIIGFSFGGYLTVRYLGTFKNELPKSLKGAVSICYPHTWSKTIDYTKKVLYGIYSRNSAYQIKEVFEKNMDNIFDEKLVLSNEDLFKNKVEICESMMNMVHAGDLDEIYTWRSLKLNSFEEYVENFELLPFIKEVSIPHLSIFTEDDPIIPLANLHLKALKENPNMITAISKTGGHLGFFSGIIPQRWIEKPIVTFLKIISVLKD